MTKPTDLKDHDLLIRLDSRQEDMANNLEKLAKSVTDLTSTFASKEELKLTARETENRLCAVESMVKILNGPRRYLNMIITSAVSGVALFLILFYLGHIR